MEDPKSITTRKKNVNIFLSNSAIGPETKKRICVPKHTAFVGLKLKENSHE